LEQPLGKAKQDSMAKARPCRFALELWNLFPFEPVFKGKLEFLLEGESEICSL
jgi:hypothetical protein